MPQLRRSKGPKICSEKMQSCRRDPDRDKFEKSSLACNGIYLNLLDGLEIFGNRLLDSNNITGYSKPLKSLKTIKNH